MNEKLNSNWEKLSANTQNGIRATFCTLVLDACMRKKTILEKIYPQTVNIFIIIVLMSSGALLYKVLAAQHFNWWWWSAGIIFGWIGGFFLGKLSANSEMLTDLEVFLGLNHK